jgi:RNA polymerase sigma-70 factor (ECF subfamily)
MFRIARNLLIDDVRRKSHDALIRAVRHGSDPEEDALQQIAEEIIPPDVQIEQAEFKQTINELLAQIPEDQRQTFTMHHFTGLSLPDVADAMDVPLATCKSRLRLAREKLVEKLELRGIRAEEFATREKTVKATQRK